MIQYLVFNTTRTPSLNSVNNYMDMGVQTKFFSSSHSSSDNIYKLKGFACTNNEMPMIERYVKSAFASLYFNNNYLKELHNSLIYKIKSSADLNYIGKQEDI